MSDARSRLASPAPGRSSRGRFRHVFAAVDLGTNNCRLLIVRPTQSGFRVVDSFSRLSRLGEGVQQTGVLSAAAVERTVDALKICAAKIEARHVTRSRWVATEACRRAANADEFLARVHAEVGVVLEIISADDEARYALIGCAPLLDYEHDHALIFDVGGGSTELMWLKLERSRKPVLIALTSLPLGVVILAERWGGESLPEAVYESMVAEVGDRLKPFEAAHAIRAKAVNGQVLLLGTSGTVTTIASVLMNLPRYDRARVDGQWIDPFAVRPLARELASWPLEKRRAHPCIGVGRADLVVAGCAVVEAIHRLWPAPRLRVADRGVREGLLVEMMRAADAEGERRAKPSR
jgi:exopolyphosphatase/guanosine-5'-triphosphate,3'-diphosphate pyrophosphatase